MPTGSTSSPTSWLKNLPRTTKVWASWEEEAIIPPIQWMTCVRCQLAAHPLRPLAIAGRRTGRTTNVWCQLAAHPLLLAGWRRVGSRRKKRSRRSRGRQKEEQGEAEGGVEWLRWLVGLWLRWLVGLWLRWVCWGGGGRVSKYEGAGEE